MRDSQRDNFQRKTKGMGAKAACYCEDAGIPTVIPDRLSIIQVHRDGCLLESIATVCKGRFQRLELLQFQSGATALEFLRGSDPDILICGDRIPGKSGEEIVTTLAANKVNFPIIVISGAPLANHWVEKFARQGLRISRLLSPFELEHFFGHVSWALDQLKLPPDP
jgi:FixJ family two-component response regulator